MYSMLCISLAQQQLLLTDFNEVNWYNMLHGTSQVLSLPVANLNDSDSGDQYFHYPVHMHSANVGERCGERL